MTLKPCTKVSRVLGAVVAALFAAASFSPRPPARACADAAEPVAALEMAERFAKERGFSSRLTGSVRARVFGIPYSQTVNAIRRVSGDSVTETAESVSALVKAAFKKEVNADGCFVSRGSYSRGGFVYGAPQRYGAEEYAELYGPPATGLVKYEWKDAIVEAKRTGEGEYKFVLDADASTRYRSREARTMMGGGDCPRYERVEFTLQLKDGQPARVVSVERFYIERFGGVNCTAQYEEIFDFL